MNSAKRTDPSERFLRNGSFDQQALVEENVRYETTKLSAGFTRKLDGTAATLWLQRNLLTEVFAMASELVRRIFIQWLSEHISIRIHRNTILVS